MASHLAFPLSLSTGGSLLTVEQDSDEEIAGSIAIALSFPRGSRRGSPRYGTPPVLFEQAPPDLGAIRAAVGISEPRADYDVELTDEYLRGAVARVRIGFDARPAS